MPLPSPLLTPAAATKQRHFSPACCVSDPSVPAPSPICFLWPLKSEGARYGACIHMSGCPDSRRWYWSGMNGYRVYIGLLWMPPEALAPAPPHGMVAPRISIPHFRMLAPGQ